MLLGPYSNHTHAVLTGRDVCLLQLGDLALTKVCLGCLFWITKKKCLRICCWKSAVKQHSENSIELRFYIYSPLLCLCFLWHFNWPCLFNSENGNCPHNFKSLKCSTSMLWHLVVRPERGGIAATLSLNQTVNWARFINRLFHFVMLWNAEIGVTLFYSGFYCLPIPLLAHTKPCFTEHVI